MTATGYALLVAALLVGVVVGYLAHRFWPRVSSSQPAGPTVADLLQRLVHTTNNGVVVLNKFGDVVLHNPRADELGFVRDNQADHRARVAASQVLRDGEAVAVDLSPVSYSRVRGREPAAVHGEARPLGDGFVVIDAGDESDAVRLEATRRDFVANVSHELKTPVGAMSLLAEAVLNTADEPDEVRRFSTKILHESTRLGTLVSELISLSRLQGAERPPELTKVDVSSVVEEALNRSKVAAESAGITVTVDEADEQFVDGDHSLLVTALSNLVDNAISYSPHGSPVSISRRLAGDYVEISVTDRGLGIESAHQRRVFERFYRVDPARSRATGGTGLGLAIVKHVAANHGGEVRLWSRQGTGSTFTLRIPRHGCSPHRPEREADPEQASAAGDVPGASAKTDPNDFITLETGGAR